MAGDAPLTGERAQRAMRMLRDVTDVLDAHSVRYWLDHGTLLGIVREQRLLPWDTDMDISMHADDFSRLEQCLPALARAGWRARLRRHTCDSPAVAAGEPRLLKVRNRKWHFLRGDLLLDVFIVHEAQDHCYWAIGKKDYLKHVRVPAHFYRLLGRYEFDGKHYPVPNRLEEYLSFRYGNWRVPVTRWNCFTDDCAIAATS